jgi:serine/threonine protein kinase
MEYMGGGDLHEALRISGPDGSGRLFGWYKKGRRIALQVAVGLAVLHKHRIVHMDLKPRCV